MFQVKIDRSKWSNGSYRPEPTRMLNSSGHMCCLGFAVKQTCNLADDSMLNNDLPRECIAKKDSVEDYTEAEKLFVYTLEPIQGYPVNHYSNNFSLEAVSINDNASLEPKGREERLIELFSKNGIQLEFYGDYHESVIQ